MRHPRRVAVLGVAAALTLVLAGCAGSVTAPGTGEPELVPAAAAATPPTTTRAVTDVIPPTTACAGMTAGEPVLEAISHNPDLTILSAALRRLPALTESLTTEPSLTVYAPSDAAFDDLRSAMGEQAFDALMADRERLDGLLSYHVTLKRYDAAGLVAAGKTTQLAYGDVIVAGEPDAITLTSTGGTTAGVLCGNVQTANATVFVVDHVLVPAT